MAVYFSNAPSLGALTGQSIGTGIGGALQQLTNSKLQQVQHQKTAQGLHSLGFNPQESSYLANLDPQILQQVVKQKLSAPGNQAYLEALQGMFGGQQQPGQPQQVSQQGQAPQLQGTNPQQSGISSLGKPGINQQQATKLAELGIKQQEIKRKEQKGLREEEIQTQEKVQPFLHAQAQDFNNAKKLYSISKRMLENLQKNKAKWPNISGYLPNVVQRDPDVRKYIADANQLVTMLAGSRKGQPTNFKVRLEQQSKPELNQPIETQIEILEGIINDSKDVFETQSDINKLKEKHKGKYPRDLETQIVEKQNAKVEPLSYPQYYKEGTIYEDDNGIKYILSNKEWKEYNG